MISKYFREFDRKVLRRKKTDEPEVPGKGKVSPRVALDLEQVRDTLAGIIPSHLTIEAAKPIDSAGFSPDGIDLIAYQKYYPDIVNILGGYVPYELVYGTYHLVQDLDKEALIDVLGRTATAKKLNMFAMNPEGEDRGPDPVLRHCRVHQIPVYRAQE